MIGLSLTSGGGSILLYNRLSVSRCFSQSLNTGVCGERILLQTSVMSPLVLLSSREDDILFFTDSSGHSIMTNGWLLRNNMSIARSMKIEKLYHVYTIIAVVPFFEY